MVFFGVIPINRKMILNSLVSAKSKFLCLKLYYLKFNVPKSHTARHDYFLVFQE